MKLTNGIFAVALAATLMGAPAVFAQQDGGPQTPAPPSAPRPPRGGGQGDHHDGMGGPGGPGGPEARLLPPGTWWRNADTVKATGLSPDQQKHIDELFLQSRAQLIDLHASLEKEELLMEPLLAANPVDQGRAMAQISKIADTRAALEKTDAKMLLSIRGVLTADQWTKLQAMHPHAPGGEHGPRGDGGHGRGGQRGPGGPGGNGPMPPAPPAE